MSISSPNLITPWGSASLHSLDHQYHLDRWPSSFCFSWGKPVGCHWPWRAWWCKEQALHQDKLLLVWGHGGGWTWTSLNTLSAYPSPYCGHKILYNVNSKYNHWFRCELVCSIHTFECFYCQILIHWICITLFNVALVHNAKFTWNKENIKNALSWLNTINVIYTEDAV